MDAARKERDRQAQTKSTTTYNDSNSHGLAVGNVTTATTTAPAETVLPGTAKSSVPAADAKAKREEDIRKLREKVQDLQDQETALKLQINDFTNQVYAAVTTQIAKDQAQANLAQAQAHLLDVQTDLSHARTDLQDLLNSPPAK